MSQEIRKAPAKVNLSLRVLGKRDDGFHELESLMAPLDLCDMLLFEPADVYTFDCDAAGVPVDESNLVTRAVRLFERKTGKLCKWRISLEKRVPHGAGLGGGSSDAATTLLALNDLEGAGMSREELAVLGAEIGSDIPFFVYEQVCMIRGRGELVEPVDVSGVSGVSLLLLKPSFGVSTPDAYKRCMDAERLQGIDYGAQSMPWGEMVNDLEMPVFFKHRFLAEMKQWLLNQPEVSGALMSGSGSTMIAFLDHEDADAIESRVREELDPTLWAQKVKIL